MCSHIELIYHVIMNENYNGVAVCVSRNEAVKFFKVCAVHSVYAYGRVPGTSETAGAKAYSISMLP